MEYVTFKEEPNDAKILCCQCGTLITPNPSNMCVGCLRTRVDITEGIPKQVTIYFCKGCERYLQPPSEWIYCALESRELLAFCLKKLKGLNRLKLIDAGFVWTEPHSKRIKVKLTVHGEVLGGAILQQVFVVEYIVGHQMCSDCHKTEAKDYWRCLVQVRQRCENKKTFFYLEQLILKHKAHENTLGIKPVHEGLDFFYSTEAHARKMVDFITNVLPCRSQHSKKLISHDIHSNTYNYKYTWSVEIVPLSKDGVVCLSKKLTQQLGGINPLCIVARITNSVHLIHPASSQIAEVSASVFWRTPFSIICSPPQMIEFVVIEIDVINANEKQRFKGQGAISHKHLLADVWVVKASELGINENTIHTRTHLGAILKPGDSVLGYNLADFNVNDDNFDKLKENDLPDVILIKKYYGERSARKRLRNWKLKHLNEDATNFNKTSDEFEEFLEDLEEDPNYRQNINIYKVEKSETTIPVTYDEMDDPAFPRITLAEMLDDLQIDDNGDIEMNE
ncbi:Nonsense-mediated mRNA decay protein, putative [Pediculus humanus corporis]|uniref:60S ribosomal export protein NMD3 n=1 Tax=Pediculus humanus subsp. corporis TaxID=121224 RepID=E0VQ58_PEDHC|nr:Nonsense-mediated mRNA decay protein, putative [Pediculus humanus corporis]EEB15514.1 Nonsense-mediated mRNA decay protein, putative [Pediculus humanus corporis]